MDISYKEYRQEIEDIAKYIVIEKVPLYEALDNHEWIIYYRFHMSIIDLCSDRNAFLEYEEGPLNVCHDAKSYNSLDDFMAFVTYCALKNDIETYLFDNGFELKDDDIYYKERPSLLVRKYKSRVSYIKYRLKDHEKRM
jgi:hypothetical protein